MNNLMDQLQMGIAITSSLWFVFITTQMIIEYGKEVYCLKEGQKLLIAGIVIISGYVLLSSESDARWANLCSVMILLVIAIFDGLTGYVYDFCGFGVVFLGAVVALGGLPGMLSVREGLFIVVYLMVIVFSAVFKGMGLGDVPIYMAALLYYLRYAAYPADAAVFMLMLSQLIFGVGLLINQKRRMPLIPSIWMAHLLTICIWGI